MEIIKTHMSKQASYKKEPKKRVVLYNTPSADPLFVKSTVGAPHFFIQKNGLCYQFYEQDVILNPMVYNDNNIYIALQNLSMLYDLNGEKLNIFNQQYKGAYTEKPWKGFKYWDNYTDNQYLKLNELLKIFNIKSSVKQSLEYMPDIINFSGICFRANFSPLFYDVTPAFEIEKIYY